MLIKKPVSSFNLKSYFKKKSNLFFIIFIILFLNSIFFAFLGAYAQKYEYTFLIRKIFTYDNNYRINIIKNFVRKPFIKIDKIYLDINFKNFKKLNDNRNIALKNKVIYKEYNENVNATIKYKDQRIPVRIKLKGGVVNHHLGKNWSFKVRTRKSNLFGLNDFALMHAQRRNYLLEWYARKMFEEEGFIYKDYKFINLYINGENKGIYVIDENYTEALSVKNNRKEGIYIRFGSDINFYWYGSAQVINDDESEVFYQIELHGCCGLEDGLQQTSIDVLNQQINSNTKNETIKNFNIAKRLLEDFRRNKKNPEEIFDLDLMAKSFALSDLLGSWHAMNWTNIKFYFDPISLKLEPVIDDNYNEEQNYPSKWRTMRITDSYNYSLLYDRLFKSKLFVEKYIFYLKRYSDPEFLSNFNNKIKKEFNINLSYINKFKTFYSFPHNHIEENRKRLERFINPYQPLYFSLWNKNTNEIILKIGNTSMLPAKISKIEIIDNNNQLSLIDLTKEKSLLNTIYFEPRFFKKPIEYKYLKFDLSLQEQIKQITLHYSIVGLDKILSKTLDYPTITKKIDDITFNDNLDTTSNFDFLEFFQNQILIRRGDFSITEDLIIPKDKELIIAAGARIDLLNGAKIISNSRIIAEGTPNDPIKIYSSDNLGQCLLVIDEERKSVLKYVYFNNLSNCSDSRMELTGSINFYKTKVLMDNIYFIDNIKGDDYLNIINSKFDLNNLFFENVNADALDIDYSKGKIVNINIAGSKNDALDLSNSSVEIKNFEAKNIGDKGISVGENSYLFGKNIIIDKAFLGLASKDQSETEIENLVITNSNIGLASYIKKHEYNSSTININKLSTSNNSQDFLFEEGSKIKIDGKINENFEINVFEKIYLLKKLNQKHTLSQNVIYD